MVVDNEGDAFFVAFASAKDAVGRGRRPARAGRARLAGRNEVRVRMGLHTGEPHDVEGRYVGLDVHHAARVMAVGHGGQVARLARRPARCWTTTRASRDLGEHRLKDLSAPQRLYQLELDGLPNDFPPLATLDNRPTNLPAQPNAFIGRERELAEARALLERDDVRLVTLIGPGGHRQDPPRAPARGRCRRASSRNGVFFVSLAPIRDWELVVPTVARTLGLREQPGETAARDADRVPA